MVSSKAIAFSNSLLGFLGLQDFHVFYVSLAIFRLEMQQYVII